MRRADTHDQWQSAEAFCRERLRADPAFDVAGCYYDKGIGWLKLIKSLRSLRGSDIFGAQKEALRNERWHAWVTRRIGSDPICAKEARAHIRQWGDAALVRLPSPVSSRKN
jgi:hypothetical protein